MYVCESEFEMKDPNEVWHSMTELDFYAWIPVKFTNTERNHRLKMWYNFKNKKYELVKDYMEHSEDIINIGNMIGLIVGNSDTGKREVIFANESLQAVLDEANGLWNHYHSEWADKIREPDKVCQHKHPHISFCCKYK